MHFNHVVVAVDGADDHDGGVRGAVAVEVREFHPVLGIAERQGKGLRQFHPGIVNRGYPNHLLGGVCRKLQAAAGGQDGA